MSFASVVEQLDATEIPGDGASLAVAVRAHDRYTARLSAAIGEYDVSGQWEVEGFTSPMAWLRELGFTHTDANVMVRNARKLRRLPHTQQAWEQGKMSGGQVKIICAQVLDRHVDLFSEHEAMLIPEFCALGMVETATAMRVWRARADALDPGAAPDDRENVAHLSSTLDDRGHLHATFDAEGYALASKALEIADSGDLDTPAPLRRGQALVEVFRFFLDHQHRSAAGRNRAHLNIVIDANTLGTDHVEGYVVDTGMSLSPATLERLLCDCDLHRVLAADSIPLNFGTAVRTPPPDLWNAIVVRDRHCRFNGCDRPASWCHAHHVEHFTRDHGSTSLDNLVLLCEHHHGVLHRTGWSAVLHPDGTFEVTNPNGNTWATKPPGTIKLKPPGKRRKPSLEQHLTSIGLEAAVRRTMHIARMRATAYDNWPSAAA